MTHSAQTSLFTSGRIYSSHQYITNIYQVVINTEDGESYEYEVEADNFAEATKMAENYANGLMEDITYIEVYGYK